jgi:RHS repeat-associated protein
VADGVRQQFVGYERDNETGLDFAQARYFSNVQGRFTSADPIYIARHRMLDPQLLNLYQYGRNNPQKYTDSTGLDVKLDCALAGKDQCTHVVTDFNNRKGSQFQVERNEKTGILEIKDKDKIDPSKLSDGERALFKALTDPDHHAEIGVLPESDFVHFGKFDGDGHNTLDASDLALLRSASKQAPGEVIAHEALEAYSASFGDVLSPVAFGTAHGFANKSFGMVTHPDSVDCSVCTPTPYNTLDWRFGRTGETFRVKTIETPVPDAGRYAYKPGKIVEVKTVK